ncbi:MAG: hypothetical protein ACJAZB_000364 [Psychrosphaera sp.]|jgi:hypothetical protein|uniref:DUF6868 family protein n=1 Tax=Psychrosphaera sp. F3M07 TaxID=2841560 RepID=UPI001C0A48D1|nr:hypothetical protein [Psychrosphaera sp. F3M07]MBU2919480.1 hypothetical protein [Psychrosphaera sp. F3M07]
MMTMAQLTEFLGWASVINIAYLSIATLALVFMRGYIFSIHSKLFGLDETDLSMKYFNFLSNYKIVTLVFMVAPYLALKVMGN